MIKSAARFRGAAPHARYIRGARGKGKIGLDGYRLAQGESDVAKWLIVKKDTEYDGQFAAFHIATRGDERRRGRPPNYRAWQRRYSAGGGRSDQECSSGLHSSKISVN